MKKLGMAVAGVLLSTVVWAQPAAQARLKAIQADPEALKSAIAAGKAASNFCANCHGEDGNSKLPEVPNLAGQNPAYVLEQIRKFGSGERKNEFMQGLIKLLKEEERVQITLYFANAGVVPGRGDAKLLARGQQLYDKLCARCHGAQAYGNETIPRLAGQKAVYLQQSIKRYRDQTGERYDPQMVIATGGLKNEDVAALANYITTMK